MSEYRGLSGDSRDCYWPGCAGAGPQVLAFRPGARLLCAGCTCLVGAWGLAVPRWGLAVTLSCASSVPGCWGNHVAWKPWFMRSSPHRELQAVHRGGQPLT